MLTPGATLDGRYEIVATLGTGGMGQVYRAQRPLLGDEVAVKVMQASSDAPPDLRQRFFRESRACAQLRHPNIVTILDFNVDQSGQPYMVMELLSGPSLRDEMALSGPMDPTPCSTCSSRSASALQLAHDRAITHRDLKPANIVGHRYESGERVYKVIDFGLAAVRRPAPMPTRFKPTRTCFWGRSGTPRPNNCGANRLTHGPTSTRLASLPTKCSPVTGRSNRSTGCRWSIKRCRSTRSNPESGGRT